GLSGIATFDFGAFDDLDDARAQQTTVHVQTSIGAIPTGDGASIALTFATRTASNQVMAITNLPFALILADGRVIVATTDATGTPVVAGLDPAALVAGTSLGLQTSLPAGLYALNAQVLDSAVGVPVALPGRIVFTVGPVSGGEQSVTTTVPGATTT